MFLHAYLAWQGIVHTGSPTLFQWLHSKSVVCTLRLEVGYDTCDS